MEMASNSLTKSAQYTEEQLANAVKLLNPLSNDLDVMRMEMLPSMLEAMQYNNNRKNSDLRLYEIGKTYSKKGEATELGNYLEQKHLAFGLLGRKQPESWNNSKVEFGYFGLKNVVELIAAKVGVTPLNYTFEEDERFEMATQIRIKKRQIGVMGKVASKTAKRYDLDKAVWYADLDLDALTELAAESKFKLKLVSVFPAVRRDLAMVLDQTVNYQQLEKIALKTAPQLIKEMNAFDVYEGDKIAAGKKSYAVSVILQDEQKTLTDVEIEEVMSKLIANFTKELGAVLRG
jgi:phenylalanyl-tRNA synthetase beta chain